MRLQGKKMLVTVADRLADFAIATASFDVTDPAATAVMSTFPGQLDGLFNCVGIVHHNMPSLRGLMSAPNSAQAEKDSIFRQLMGRFANVDDITPMVAYLLSDESRFVTGQSLLVGGGVTI